ncbi:MAG: trimethylamine methyltransferase family protein [Rhodobacteraceae bacterium]|nr:trimethylamine methyltransferase family protein [Paracoccaceae bacterium]
MSEPSSRRRRGRTSGRTVAPHRSAVYRHLRHPFAPQSVFSDDEIANLHETALRVLEELGLRILLPEAREIFAAAGAIVRDDMVYIGRDIVTGALATAPSGFTLNAANPDRALSYAPGSLIFKAGAGCPNASDLERGRRPGTLEAFEETLKLCQSFDVIHSFGPCVEPQDVPIQFRHYAMTRAQLTLGDKPMFVYARGRGQVEEAFELIRIGLNLSDDDFADGIWASTNINTNSPRLIDRPMAQGIIDFARAGQMAVVTPFCLAGAMAPVTVAGALTLQHAEALAGISLSQLARPGAPVSYGGFSSNVDMKSGSPAFGTPEMTRMQIGSGQLARLIGLPWRSAAGSASNAPDMQAANENDMGLWGCMMSNATLVVHAAGWLEGGLSFGYEKFINDVEMLQSLAELCQPADATADAIGFDALAEVAPGGHFFATAQTMDRYETAFYTPLVANLDNHGSWTESGAKTSSERATAIWKDVLTQFSPPVSAAPVQERIARLISDHEKRGGTLPLD